MLTKFCSKICGRMMKEFYVVNYVTIGQEIPITSKIILNPSILKATLNVKCAKKSVPQEMLSICTFIESTNHSRIIWCFFFYEDLYRENQGSWECNLCDYKSVRWSNLKRHIECKHVAGPQLTCNFCNVKCPSKPALIMHIHRNHK